ncbi:hypothetical protein N7281_00215 [Rickettsia hoogstraalii]|uniref:hypothetical protein n=1 Tax=Rickettsia hoogstraalii TaxID=467174 RepID=UPI00224D469E|nr:hypothetical protein [Rickettsia hoogstraalii]MCX4083339.1 hypothetical protein [Rickettsia hoogstraalii]
MDVAGYDGVAPAVAPRVDPMVPPPTPPRPKDYVAEYKNSTDNNKKNIFEVGEKIKARTPERLEAKIINTKVSPETGTEVSNQAGRVYYALHAGRNTNPNDAKAKIANLEKDLRDTVTILLAQEFVKNNRGVEGKSDKDFAKEFLEIFTNGDLATKLTANRILITAVKNNAHIKEIIDQAPKINQIIKSLWTVCLLKQIEKIFILFLTVNLIRYTL